MPDIIFHEIELTGRCFLIGIEFMVLYDLLRISRILLPRSFFLIGVEDFIYWFYISLKASTLFYRYNSGILRGYAIVFIAIGMIIYNCTISRFLLNMLKKILQYIKMKANK